MKRFIFLTILMFSSLMLKGTSWEEGYRYTYYGISDGLCDDYVTSTYRDRSGYLWICTSNGLDRFDGHFFTHFSSHSEEEATYINNDFIYSVTEDLSGNIWGVTNSGIFKIDKSSGRNFCSHDFPNWQNMLSRHMNGIRTDKSGNLWIQRPDGLTYVSLNNKGEITNVTEVQSSSVSIRYIAPQDDIVWTGGLSGIECWQKGHKDSIKPVSLEEHPVLASIKGVSTLLVQGKYLWIGTENGLFMYNTQEKILISWKHEETGENSLSDDHVTCLAGDGHGDLIIGTIKGIDRLSRDGKFRHMRPGKKGHSLNTEYINHILLDEDGTMWVSTLIKGINQISPKNISFEEYLSADEGTPNIISCIFEDKDGNILMGVLGKGLGIRKKGSDDIRIFSLKDSGISQEDIFVIRQDRNGNYWMASRNDGLLFLDRKNLDNPSFIAFNQENTCINSNVIYDMDYDSARNGIWFSSLKSLYFINIDEKTPVRMNLSTDNGNPLRYHNIILDSKDRLWIGGYGLCMIDLSQNKSTSDVYRAHFFPSLKENHDGTYERITSITEAKDGTIYAGSQNNGVYQMDKNGKFSPIPVSNQKFRQRISKLLTDDYGNLWISTPDGIFHYAPETYLMTRIGTEDGLSSYSCYLNSGHRLSNGDVAFGTSNGMVVMDTPINTVSSHDRVTKLTNITKKNSHIIKEDIEHIDIYPDESLFTIHFSALDLTNADKISYSYMLDGIDESWNLTQEGMVRYNSLKPGQYNFRVRCTNRDNSWSQEETLLDIRVHPHFYQTLWFWGIILFLILGCFCYIIYMKITHQKEIETELVAQVEEKTANLKKQNMELAEQKAKIEEYIVNIDKVNREKLMMYTNLTHEFKTPLTLIMGPVSELISTNKDEDMAPVLQIIDRNAKHLLQLVNQILSLRRVDAREMKMKKAEFNIARLLDIYNLDFSTMLKDRNISFVTDMRMIHRHIHSDRDMIHKILSNLISNAVKHTPAGGTITLRMAQIKRRENGQIMQYLSVTNTGSVILPSEFDNIFECFYKIESQPVYQTGISSSGIGLYLVKQLVTELGGEIRIKSSQKTGTSFRVLFPVDLVESVPPPITDNYPEPVISEDGKDSQSLLLVEDNDDMRAYVKSILREKYTIIEAQDGEQGFAIAKRITPDLIISDLMMPKLNGIELCRMIRNDKELSHIPFLMLTAISNDAARTESYKEGVDAFLVKPFQKEMLLARIESMLSNRRIKQDEVFSLNNAHDTVNIENKDKVFLENLMAIMKDNYTNPDFNVPQLQSQMCMSMTSFYKKITTLTGLTPAHFIRLYRLQTAKNILESQAGNSGINVSEIAYTVGFNDPKYFSKCFQSQYNILPSAILQGNKKNNPE